MKKIAKYPAFFRSLTPSLVQLLGTPVGRNLWNDVYLRIDDEVFYLSVSPMVDDPDFDYIFCMELIVLEKPVDSLSMKEVALLDSSPKIQPTFFVLSERLDGDAMKSIKRITLNDRWRMIVVEPSYENYFSWNITIKNASGHLKSAF